MAILRLSRYQDNGTQSIANTSVSSLPAIQRACYKIFTGLLDLATSRVIRLVISIARKFTQRFASITRISMSGWQAAILRLYWDGCVKIYTPLVQSISLMP